MDNANLLHALKEIALEMNSLKDRIIIIENFISQNYYEDYAHLKGLLEDVCDTQHNRIKIPHRCPICNGTTFDEEGALCHPCDGKGIVWG